MLPGDRENERSFEQERDRVRFSTDPQESGQNNRLAGAGAALEEKQAPSRPRHLHTPLAVLCTSSNGILVRRADASAG